MLIYKSLKEEDYHQALKNQEFDLAYQPIMNFENDGFETFEAFIRWHHPVLGTLAPGIFMANIEKYNLQEEITGYIFDLAVTQILNNSRLGYGETGVSINLSLKEFYNPKTVIQLQKAISKLPFPEFLGIEVTPKILTAYAEQEVTNPDPEYDPDSVPSERERKYLENISSIVKEYARLGITLALDTTDHVIGSLIRADILGFHALKISTKALNIALITDSQRIQEFVQASKDFQIPIIAVGLENKNLFRIAYNNGMTYAQGLFLCPPLCLKNPKEFTAHLNSYYAAKEDFLSVENSVKNLNIVKQKLVDENISSIQSSEDTLDAVSNEYSVPVKEEEKVQKNSTIAKDEAQIDNYFPNQLTEKIPSNSSYNEFENHSMVPKKTISNLGELDNFDDVFSKTKIDPSYLEDLGHIEAQLKGNAPSKAEDLSVKSPTQTIIDRVNVNKNSSDKGFTFGRRKWR